MSWQGDEDDGDIEQRFAAVDERLAAAEADVAELTRRSTMCSSCLVRWFDQHAKQAMDTQTDHDQRAETSGAQAKGGRASTAAPAPAVWLSYAV